MINSELNRNDQITIKLFNFEIFDPSRTVLNLFNLVIFSFFIYGLLEKVPELEISIITNRK